MDQLFVDFCNKLQTRSRTLPQFLVPFIGILTNLYMAISELSPTTNPVGAAVASLSADLSQFDELLTTQAAASQEEAKHNDDFEIPVDSYDTIRQAMPFSGNGSKTTQFDSLADMINRMSSFDPSLFKRLLEIVLNELRPANQHEVKVFQTYNKMLAETEMLIMCKKIRNDSIDSNEGPMVEGS